MDNITFDSKAEMERYRVLKLLLVSGEIRDLELQPEYLIELGGVKVMMRSKRYHKKGRQLKYIADFRYFCTIRDTTIIEDVKMASGHRPEAYKIKKALMEAMGYQITEV